MIETPTEQPAAPSSPLAELVPPVAPTRLSAELEMLLSLLDDKPLSIGDLETALKGRGFAFLLLLLSLPFCVVPVPGLSGPFGVAITLIGIRMTLGQSPWLPEFVRRIRFSPDRMRKLLQACIRFSRWMEKIARPRMQFLQTWPGMMNLIGLSITLSGFLLALPLPIPFSNVFPAAAIVMLTAGMIERDGLLVLLGHLANFASWVFCIAAGASVTAALVKLWNGIFY